MILTVDIGNTTVALTGLQRRGADYDAVFEEKIPSDKEQGDFDTPVERLLDGHFARNSERINGAVLSSVVPCLTEPVCRAVERAAGVPPVVISARDCVGLRFDVDAPDKIGLDRIADSVWAARYPLPAVTADLGTAATFNVIGEGGVFLGGMIAPGLRISLDALSERAAQLPKLPLSVPGRLIGRSTAECMLSGTVIGAAAMVDGIAERVETELGAPVTLILTGGGSKLAEPFCRYPHIYEPLLPAKGMAYIFENLPRNPG